MRNMQGQNYISRVNFETNKHHRQILREQIKPQLFHKLEVSENPSANYINAYKSVFKDQLQKTMQQRYQKKIKDQYQNIEDKMTYSLNQMSPSRLRLKGQEVNSSVRQEAQMYEQQNLNSLSPKNSSFLNSGNPHLSQMKIPSNKKFRDYFEERTDKFQNHIKNNFDGGQQFFKVQDAYKEKRMKQTRNYANILKKQIQQNEYQKINQRQKQNMEFNEQKQMRRFQLQYDRQKNMKQHLEHNQQNLQKINEVYEQRQRRQLRQKKFQYNNYALHNPITNPIEYHIDNPYILKRIQDKTIF